MFPILSLLLLCKQRCMINASATSLVWGMDPDLLSEMISDARSGIDSMTCGSMMHSPAQNIKT